MSKKNCAHRVVVLITVLMLSLAPVTFAGDGGGSSSILSTIDSIVESISEALDDLFGGDTPTPNDSENEDEDGGLPDYGPDLDPNG